MKPALLNVMLCACLLTACAKPPVRVKPLPAPPSVIEAAKATPLPVLPSTSLNRPGVEALLIDDARAIAQCNADKAALFAAGWPK